MSSKRPSLQSLLQSPGFNTFSRFLALLAVFGFFAILVADGRFYSPRNLENILRQSAVYATAGLGMTLVIISAGIDLSVGSIIALAVVMVAWTLNLPVPGGSGELLIHQYPTGIPLLAVLAAVLTATLAGMLNGIAIVGLRLIPFIVTLGMMGIVRGVAKGIAKERDIYPEAETWIHHVMDPVLTGNSSGGFLLPLGVWFLIFGILISVFILRFTRLGRHIYAIGSNEETARLCGVPVQRTKVIVYALTGTFCGVAGIMQFSYLGGIGQPTTAMMYELFVIAAVIIGGASFRGGEGSILGTMIGALIITILYMGGQQMGWPKWVQEMVIGVIIIAAVAIDQYRHRKQTH
ncbi:MAG: ABC transporter permease [Kiritimatiellia bacterium]